jgi:hypothetical protein
MIVSQCHELYALYVIYRREFLSLLPWLADARSDMLIRQALAQPMPCGPKLLKGSSTSFTVGAFAGHVETRLDDQLNQHKSQHEKS